MIKAAIVEDERSAADTLAEFLNRYAQECGESFELRAFTSGVDFLTNYDPQYDLVFMDIEMPDINGIKTAERLRSVDPVVGLVFITNLARYAIKGYEFNAIDYILKPLSYPGFKLKLHRILSRIRKEGKSQSITVSTRVGKNVVDISDIHYVEVSGHNVVYHTAQGDFTAYGTLKDACRQFPETQFVRCNSCYLVNLAHVAGFDGAMLKVDKYLLEISRSRRREFLEAFNRYRLGGGS